MNKTETTATEQPKATTLPLPSTDATEDKYEVLRKLFTMNYIASHKPKSDIFIAENLENAKSLALAYCRRFNLRYLSVQPFTIDIMKDSGGFDRFQHPKDGHLREY